MVWPWPWPGLVLSGLGLGLVTHGLVIITGCDHVMLTTVFNYMYCHIRCFSVYMSKVNI